MTLPTDPMLAQQWHLRNPNPLLLDLNVFGVWDPAEGPAYTGAGTRVFVIDSGIDYTHSDLAPNYNLFLDFDFETNTEDAFGGPTELHGTAVAGIIGAAANGDGAVGVAFGTDLVGYRTAQFISDDWLQDIRDAILYAGSAERFGDVMNISQGIANDADSEFGNGYNAVRFDEIEASIGSATSLGRGGLGTTIVKSAGNSRGDDYDVNSDDWTNDTRQVVVAAVDQDGFVSSYSSYGAANLVSGFGTPGEVVTTDRVGAAGYNGTDFTSSFNGTSSAAPMVTGVVSLMYDAEAGLGWRDVQSILGVSARHVGSAVGAAHSGSELFDWGFNAAGTWNGGGQHFSNDYGYGLVDALAAVRLAETWLITGTAATVTNNELTNTVDVLNVATVIPDGNGTGLNFVGNAFFDDVVERVTVEMTFSTTFMADVEVYLTSPDGTVSRLIDDQAGTLAFNGTWTFESQAFRGERAAGNWTVRVVDDAGGDVLTVSDIVIRTFGASTVDDRYIYTNEYSDYAGLFGHVTAVTDSNGGTDTANAAAVTTGSDIRLDGSVGTIDGIATTFSGIENAIGGDGNDTITGNASVNQLFGMRGADLMNGGAGNDTLNGGAGNDTLNGATGNDSMIGGSGNDVFTTDGGDTITEAVGQGTDTVRSSVSHTLGANLENLVLFGAAAINGVGNALANTMTGNAAANTLNGGAGNDTLNGATGNDSMIGGSGNDVFTTDGGDTITEAVGQGTDTVRSSVSHTLGANLENLVLIGAAAINGTGNALANTMTGNAAANTMNGGAGNDTLNGGAGNDTLNGATGNDSMIGGSGNDVFTTDGGDTITEAVGQGTDTVRSSVSHTLGANLENLVLFGAAAINGVGNALANTMTGNAAANTLNGGAGNDTLNGATGNDSMIGGSGNDVFTTDGGDTITEAVGQGTDTVRSSVSHTLGANLENLVLTGAAAINGAGNALANTMTGNAAANTMNGGAGNDTLNGGAGNDTLTGGLGNDQMNGGGGADAFVFTSVTAPNVDTIIGYSVVDDTIRLENAVFTGLANGALAASAFTANLTGFATDALDRIIYETDTGNLFFDSNGSAAGGRVQFAVVSAGLAMTNADFFVV